MIGNYFFSNSGAAAYEIEQSLRFDGSGTYLQRTPSSSGDRYTFTISFWIKRGQLGSHQQNILTGNAQNGLLIAFTSTDELYFYDFGIVSGGFQIWSQKKFRDPSAWYHIVFAADTTQATASDRVKVWVNGVQEDLSTYNVGSGAQRYPGQYGQFDWNHTNGHEIGYTNADCFEGYLAEIHNVDGSQLDHEDFGEFDNNGVWRPIEFAPTAVAQTPSYTSTYVSGMSNTDTPQYIFDGSLQTAGNRSISGAGTFSYSGSINTSGATTVRMRVNFGASSSQVGSNTNLFTVNGTDVTQKAKNANAYAANGPQWIDITTEAGNAITAFEGKHISNVCNCQIYAIDIDGVLVRDAVSGWGQNGFYLQLDPSATNGLGHDYSGDGNNFTDVNLFYEIGTPNYANNWIGSTSGSIYSGSWENVFDGNASVLNSFVYVYNQTSTLTFSTALSGVIEVLASNGTSGASGSGTMRVSLSDGSTYDVNNVTRTNTPFYSFGSKSNITSITITSSGGGNHGTILGAIRVDGDLLANNSAKANYDTFSDTPTNNFCTWNPLDNTGVGLENGNLDFNYTGAKDCGGTFALTSGKWYWEIEVRLDIGQGGQPLAHGIHNASVTSDFRKQAVWFYTDEVSAGIARRYANNSIASDVSVPSSLRSIDIGDYVQCAYDADSGKVWFGVNNTWMDGSGGTSGNPGTGSNPVHTLPDTSIPMTPWRSHAGLPWNGFTNFGQRDYQYTPPTGFKSVCTANLPAPDIADGSDYFKPVLYTGDNTNQAITGVGFQPDWVWIKSRNNVSDHVLQDAVRGAQKFSVSNRGDAEDTDSGTITSFDSDGFTIGSGNNKVAANNNGWTFVAWNWLAGNGTSSNTDGSITSTVSANATAGFSVVTYTSPNSSSDQTVGHGLGVKPDLIIVKNRDNTYNWDIYHSSLGYNASLIFTSAATRSGAFGAEPTSTVFTTKTSYTHNSTHKYVAYCFTEVEGYSKFGSYTGSGGQQFVHLGFAPEFVMLKRSDSSSDTHSWFMFDSTRDPINNNAAEPLMANKNFAEGTLPNGGSGSSGNIDFDFYSNGFGFPSYQGVGLNGSGATIVYAAFAKNPFGGDGVSPATAR